MEITHMGLPRCRRSAFPGDGVKDYPVGFLPPLRAGWLLNSSVLPPIRRLTRACYPRLEGPESNRPESCGIRSTSPPSNMVAQEGLEPSGTAGIPAHPALPLRHDHYTTKVEVGGVEPPSDPPGKDRRFRDAQAPSPYRAFRRPIDTRHPPLMKFLDAPRPHLWYTTR